MLSSVGFVVGWSKLDDLLRPSGLPDSTDPSARFPRVVLAHALMEARLAAIETFGCSGPNADFENPERILRNT